MAWNFTRKSSVYLNQNETEDFFTDISDVKFSVSEESYSIHGKRKTESELLQENDNFPNDSEQSENYYEK